ncbi:Alanine racemase N-terminal [Trinorchestia longiramus]|nr:Alanine racemase N-terminal [Trinorchestia longiramus]
MAVVKGAAYGSEVLGVATAALEAGAKELAVATVSEGVFLCKQGISAPITVLGNLSAEELPDVLTHHLYPTLSWTRALQDVHPDTLKYLNGCPLEVHVEVDTGMSRFGVQPEDLPSVMATLEKLGVKVRSIYTHFQSAITQPQLNKRQYDCFVAATELFL